MNRSDKKTNTGGSSKKWREEKEGVVEHSKKSRNGVYKYSSDENSFGGVGGGGRMTLVWSGFKVEWKIKK